MTTPKPCRQLPPWSPPRGVATSFRQQEGVNADGLPQKHPIRNGMDASQYQVFQIDGDAKSLKCANAFEKPGSEGESSLGCSKQATKHTSVVIEGYVAGYSVAR